MFGGVSKDFRKAALFGWIPFRIFCKIAESRNTGDRVPRDDGSIFVVGEPFLECRIDQLFPLKDLIHPELTWGMVRA
jgi:hypothetical protein